MLFHENYLLAEDSDEISYHIFVENWKKMSQNLLSAAVMTGALRANKISQKVKCWARDVLSKEYNPYGETYG